MKCPFCGEPLVKLDEFNVSVDICPSCRGICLAHGTFERILRMVSQEPPVAPPVRNGRRGELSRTGTDD